MPANTNSGALTAVLTSFISEAYKKKGMGWKSVLKIQIFLWHPFGEASP